MTQREKPCHGMNHPVHGFYRIGGTAHGKTDNRPKRADTHRHSQTWHDARDEHTKTLTGQYRQDSHKHNIKESTLMGKVKIAVNLKLKTQENGEEHDCMGQQFADKGNANVTTSHHDPILRATEFHLCPYRIRY